MAAIRTLECVPSKPLPTSLKAGESVKLTIAKEHLALAQKKSKGFYDFGLYNDANTPDMDPEKGGVDMKGDDYIVTGRFAAGTQNEAHLFTASETITVTAHQATAFAVVLQVNGVPQFARKVRSNRQAEV